MLSGVVEMKRWIEVPDQILDDPTIFEKVRSYPFVTDITRGEVGYNFYESAFVKVELNS